MPNVATTLKLFTKRLKISKENKFKKGILDFYLKKQRWKQFLMIGAILIGVSSLLYTNHLVKQVSYEEQVKVDLWTESVRMTLAHDSLSDEVFRYINAVFTTNKTVPIIVVDENETIIADNNFNYNEKNRDKILQREYQKLKARTEPIVIELGPDEKQYLYFKESRLLIQLRYYPIFQLLVIVLFIFISYYAFNSARKSEQNMVWVGMAKETAHQLGTPISSLMAWVELLKEMELSNDIVTELAKDTHRLEQIAERFSKVGSTPELYPENVYRVLNEAISYLKPRISKKIELETRFDPAQELYLPLSSTLFGWVVENLIRNAVDAMEGAKGRIQVQVYEREQRVIIEIADNGKGIPKSKQKAIFKPGFTTKKRGWGLGLTLSKRIIENYHNGKLLLRYSDAARGTAFWIILAKK
jgi:signal transduction histidine kinase